MQDGSKSSGLGQVVVRKVVLVWAESIFTWATASPQAAASLGVRRNKDEEEEGCGVKCGGVGWDMCHSLLETQSLTVNYNETGSFPGASSIYNYEANAIICLLLPPAPDPSHTEYRLARLKMMKAASQESSCGSTQTKLKKLSRIAHLCPIIYSIILTFSNHFFPHTSDLLPRI